MIVAVFGLISFVLGAAMVWATVFLQGKVARIPSGPPVSKDDENAEWNQRLKKQLDNLLAYDGSERGQQEIE